MTIDRRRLVRVFGPAAESATGVEDAARRSDRLFVRADGQLAVYGRRERRGPKPAERRFSAWEAYKAFGLDALDDAIGRPAAGPDSELDLVTELFDVSNPDPNTLGIEDIIDDIARRVPDSEWSRLPDDLSHRHDRYLYGGDDARAGDLSIRRIG